MTISLWAVQLKRILTEDEENRLFRLLPKERQSRLLKISQKEQWQEPLAAYGLLALALNRCYGLTKIPHIRLGDQGKPFFPENPGIEFSISHTKSAVLVGLSAEALGVDLEQNRILSKRTLHRLEETGETAEHFLRDWVRYEALVKRTGKGVEIHHHLTGEEDVQDVDIFPNCFSAVSGVGPITVCYQGTIDTLLEDLP